MLVRLVLGCMCTIASGAALTISPPVIYDCSGIHGRAKVVWSGASGPVKILVGPARVPMTGVEPPAGIAETGDWVSDGLRFLLVNERGEVEAAADARVRCGAGREASANGLVSESFFSLEIGNTWVYRLDSRQTTSTHVTWTVTGTVLHSDRIYHQISSLGTVILDLRADSDGRIWRYANGQEELYLNPNAERRTGFTHPLGVFPDAVLQTVNRSLGRDENVFVRGVGLLKTSSTMLTGSSGGFVSSLDLEEAILQGGVHLKLPAAEVSLSVESQRLDVTGRKVTNCAVPCYFVACGLTPGADPPNTYKPCFRARTIGSGLLDLLDPTGAAVFTTSVQPFQYVQVPLYSAPNQPFVPGEYQLRLRVSSMGHQTSAVRLVIE